MDIEHIKEKLFKEDGLASALGMEFLSTPEPDMCEARMKVDSRNTQPFGFLSGGASLALAETLAGVGSLALCPGEIALGISVSGTHVKAVVAGDTVRGVAKMRHKGKTLHQWQVDIYNSKDELISTIQVTNYVVKAK